MGDDRPSVYHDPEIDRWVYRASSLGACDRELVAHRRGMVGGPTPDWLQVRFDEGHDWEDRILKRMEDDQSVSLGLAQHQTILDVGKQAAVRGSIDAYDDLGTVVDAKFLGPDLFAKLRDGGIQAFPHYWWQQGVYAHGMRAEGYKVDNICLAMGLKQIEGKGEDRQIVGVKAMHYLWVDVADLPTVAQIKARVMGLEKLAGRPADEWPECPVPFQYPCAFDWLHEERDVAIEVEGEMEVKLRDANTHYEMARDHEDKAKYHKGEGKRLVEEVLAAEDLTPDAGHKLRAGDLEVQWVYSKTEAKVIEKYERKESIRAYPKFTVKEKD
jgi:hypothetical protein